MGGFDHGRDPLSIHLSNRLTVLPILLSIFMHSIRRRLGVLLDLATLSVLNVVALLTLEAVLHG